MIMGLFDWLRNKLSPKNMTEKLFEQVAFHESGYIRWMDERALCK
jgi:hypothetical protein